MELLEIIGFIAAIAVGISLGLIGGGGSILTVPILVYLMDMDPVLATAYSLFTVGISSLIGGVKYAQRRLVSVKTGVVFAIPALISVYLARLLIVPAIPRELFALGDFTLTKNTGILLLFAVLMVSASISMIRDKRKPESAQEEGESAFNFPLIVIEGVVVGVLTGIVGAGGGFLIIPALVLLAKLPMKKAVGTSLFIVAAKSLIGFIGDLQTSEYIDWTFLLVFTGIAVIGIFIGSYLSRFINGPKLKKGFGWFVLFMGAFMIIKEVVLK